MGNKTGISWTDATWNPIRGCSRVSEGCRHCYAEVQAGRIVRMGKGKPTAYDGLVKLVDGEPRWTGEVAIDPVRLAAPLHWRAPRRAFVDSMSDLFYDKRPDEHIAAVFGVMAATPHITYQILTKYAARMRAWFGWIAGLTDRPGRARERCAEHALEVLGGKGHGREQTAIRMAGSLMFDKTPRPWPLPNVWLGVSVENQDAADERIPELLATPAALWFLSCEPLLGALNLRRWLPLTDNERHLLAHGTTERSAPRVAWVIDGCESGPGARPCDTAWLRSLREQCAAAGVPYFLKQAEEHTLDRVELPDGRIVDQIGCGPGSKHKAGGVIELPYLDGVQHCQFPEPI